MNEFSRFKYFLSYQWKAKTKYYLHSPFVYQFYLNVLEDHSNTVFNDIDLLRKKLQHDNTPVQINDFGTGASTQKTISALESKVAVRPKYGRLLYRLVKYFKPKSILELGTSIGLSSSYFALANSKCNIISLEGDATLIELARKNHAQLGLKNISVRFGNFDETLAKALGDLSQPDLVFFDGNHRKAATLGYFNQCLDRAHAETIFIFDDIHWSAEMNEAWNEIKAHPQITLSLDVFQFGICFFRKEKLAKEEFTLRY